MNTITIPRKIAGGDDLIIMPRREYETLLESKKAKTFRLTTTQKKALIRAERNLLKKKTFSYHELVKELGFAR